MLKKKAVVFDLIDFRNLFEVRAKPTFHGIILVFDQNFVYSLTVLLQKKTRKIYSIFKKFVLFIEYQFLGPHFPELSGFNGIKPVNSH